jgi:hypothetical protein
VTRRDKKRVYIGIALLVCVLFGAGVVAGYVSRNDKICSDGKPPLRERPDVLLGHVIYDCGGGEIVTR